MKHSIRELKLIDDPLNYVHNLTRIVSYNLSEAGREFLRLFNNDAHCFSGKKSFASSLSFYKKEPSHFSPTAMGER